MRKQPTKRVQPRDTLSGANPRHEVAGCPTGLDPDQAQLPQHSGGGGAPGTGAVDLTVPAASTDEASKKE